MKPKHRFSTLHSAGLAMVSAITLGSLAHAADVYWDINGATAGAGGATPSGNWDTSTANWSTDSTGSSATTVWTNGDNAIFSAGTDATGQFNVAVTNVTAGNITVEEGRVQLNSSTLTLNSGINTYTVARTSGDYDLRINSVVAGTGSIVKEGAGMLMLTGNNTFSGGITLNAGTLNFESSNTAFGTGTLTLNGGNLAKTWGNAVTFSNAVNVTGTTNVGIVQGSANDMTFTGAFTGSGTFQVNNASINGFGTVAASIKIAGSDLSTQLAGYTGTFEQTTGNNRLRFGAGGGSASTVTIDASNAKFLTHGSTSSGAPIDMGDNMGGTFKMGELAGDGGIIRPGWGNAAGTTDTTFEVGALNTASKFAGSLQDNTGAGPGGHAVLNKVGTGTLQLALATGNSYTGGTTVTAGRLLVSNTSNSGTGTGAVSVAASAILGGTGRIAPTGANGISISGTIAPGGSVSATTGGSFSGGVGSLTLNLASTTGTVQMLSGSVASMDLGAAGLSLAAAGTSDQIVITGASAGDLAFNGNSFDFNGTGAVGFYKLVDTDGTGTTYTGLTFDGTTGVVSSGITTTNLAGGLNGTFIVGTGSNGADSVGDIYLQVTAVPEPSAALLGGLGVLGLLRRRRTA